MPPTPNSYIDLCFKKETLNIVIKYVPIVSSFTISFANISQQGLSHLTPVLCVIIYCTEIVTNAVNLFSLQTFGSVQNGKFTDDFHHKDPDQGECRKIYTTKNQNSVFYFICFFFSFRAPKNLELKKRHLKHQQGITTSVREYKRRSITVYKIHSIWTTAQIPESLEDSDSLTLTLQRLNKSLT